MWRQIEMSLRMKIFVGEYICGGGLSTLPTSDVASSLLREGKAMLSSLLEDISQFAEVHTIVDVESCGKLLHLSSDRHLDRNRLHVHKFSRISSNSEEELIDHWVRVAKTCDLSLIVAPETDKTLLRIVESFRDRGIEVVAPSKQFIEVASDKRETATRLSNAGVPHPFTTWLQINQGDAQYHTVGKYDPDKKDRPQSFLIKPHDGCGSQGICWFGTYSDALRALQNDQVLQEKASGKDVSIAVISSDKQTCLLPAVSQTLDADTLEYLGGEGPLSEALQDRARNIALQALNAMPEGKRGFIGLDLIIGDSPELDYVIEINPRVTTSYVGLRKMIAGNLAAKLFDLEFGSINDGHQNSPIRWNADGTLSQ